MANMVKLIVFDFDGTLVSLKEVHFLSLNQAIREIAGPQFEISKEEHVKFFDGLSTRKKLSYLVELKQLPKNKIEEIFHEKQRLTIQMMNSHLNRDPHVSLLLGKLKEDGFKIFLASNAIRSTVEAGLKKLEITEFFDHVFCNEDVKNQKPHPEVYLKCMVEAGVCPEETLVVEDGKHGRNAGRDSGAFVCGVDSPENLTYWKIYDAISETNKRKNSKWVGNDLNILIPMGGKGSRFKNAGYKLPKPLIDVDGKPMIQRVIENLNIDGQFIFIVDREQNAEHNLALLLGLMVPGCKVIDSDMGGAAFDTLLAKDLIDNDKHLLIANSDQIVEDFDSSDFLYSMISSEVDGGILTFKATGTKWSYAKIEENRFVSRVAEKVEISDDATVGIYYYRRGADYVRSCQQMIEKDIRTNNEFYICPVFNELIENGGKVKCHEVREMRGIGTPEDLQAFLEKIK